ncbi:MAG: c-type cytochrome [Acidimicrobiia bacterium]
MRGSLLLVSTLVVALSACTSGADDPMSEGRRLYLQHCTACHGDFGEGGIGRPLADVVSVFPECAIHVTWITIGSVRWLEEVGPTYGAGNRAPEGIMPSFGGTLTDEQIRVVAAYERADFGGVTESVAFAGCSVALPSEASAAPS